MYAQSLYKIAIITIIIIVALSTACTNYWNRYKTPPSPTTNLAYIKAYLYCEQEKYDEAKKALKPALRQYPENKDLKQLEKNITLKTNHHTNKTKP